MPRKKKTDDGAGVGVGVAERVCDGCGTDEGTMVLRGERMLCMGCAEEGAQAAEDPGIPRRSDDVETHAVRWIRVDSIDVDAGHRRKMSEKAWERSIAELGEQLAQEGMLNPIKVCGKGDGRYRLVFGLRRLSAAAARVWETVPAMVAGPMTDAQVEAERLSENVNRENPSPIDEMVGVNAVYDAEQRTICEAQLGAEVDESDPVVQEELHERTVLAVAERINRPVKWVRDRLYLRRLSPEVQEAVIEGRVPLLHARELARLGDHKAQEQLLHGYHVALDEDGTGGVEIEQLRFQVSRRLTRLEGVAWRLELPFAGKPACEGCEHNTATDALLFEGADPPEKAMCTNPACYEAKRKEAEKAANAAATKVAGMLEKGTLEKVGPNVLVEKSLVPEYVKPATVAARARARAKPAGGSRPAKSNQPAERAPRETAEQKLEAKANEAWRKLEIERIDNLVTRVEEHLRTDPMRVWAAALAQMTHKSGRYDYAAGRVKAAKQSKLHERAVALLKAEVFDDAELAELTRAAFAEHVKKPMHIWDFAAFYLDDWRDELGDILMGPLPDADEWREQWMRDNAPAPEEEKPKTAKKATKKKAAKRGKKKAGKKAARKGVRS